MTTAKLSAAMTRAIITAYESCGTIRWCDEVTTSTARALVARGLATPIVGKTERANRYSRHAQTVYDALLGFRLTEEGKTIRAALRERS